MIFQFAIIAIGAICATILALAGLPSTGEFVMGGCVFAFLASMVGSS